MFHEAATESLITVECISELATRDFVWERLVKSPGNVVEEAFIHIGVHR